MSRHRYFLFSILFVACGQLVAGPSMAADLKTCKSAKQRQLQLEKSGRKAAEGSRGSRRRQMAELDEWLWKHCRSHSRELRELERQRL